MNAVTIDSKISKYSKAFGITEDRLTKDIEKYSLDISKIPDYIAFSKKKKINSHSVYMDFRNGTSLEDMAYIYSQPDHYTRK